MTVEEDEELQRRRDEERKARREERERQEERDRAAIAQSMEDLEEVDEIAIREDKVERASLGSLPSVEEEKEEEKKRKEESEAAGDHKKDAPADVKEGELDRVSIDSLPSVDDNILDRQTTRRDSHQRSPEEFRPRSRGRRYSGQRDRSRSRLEGRSYSPISNDNYWEGGDRKGKMSATPPRGEDDEWDRRQQRGRRIAPPRQHSYWDGDWRRSRGARSPDYSWDRERRNSQDRRSWSRDRGGCGDDRRTPSPSVRSSLNYERRVEIDPELRPRLERQAPPKRRPPQPCLICKSTEHRAKECPDLVCYKCNEKGHFAKECVNPPAPRPPRQGPSKQEDSNYTLEDDDTLARRNSKDNKPPPKCFNCNEVGHHIKECPTLYCKKCGRQGHFAKECTVPSGPGQAMQVPPPPAIGMISQKPWATGEGPLQKKPPTRPKPVGTLFDHFSRRLSAQGREPGLADQMVLTWRMAGHTEETLWALFCRETPSTASEWRLALLKELSHMQAAQIPAAVRISDLMDETVAFHMPDVAGGIGGGGGGVHVSMPSSSSSSIPPAINTSVPPPPSINFVMGAAAIVPPGGNSVSSFQSTFSSSSMEVPISSAGSVALSAGAQVSGALGYQRSSSAVPSSQVQLPSQHQLQSALRTVSSIERLRELDQSILARSSQNPRLRDEYEGRVLGLDPLREFVAKKMRVMSAMFGISENYIQTVSTTIQKLLAHVDLSLYVLKRSFDAYGTKVVEEQLKEKLGPFSADFPNGVTVEYIISMVCDFLKDDSSR